MFCCPSRQKTDDDTGDHMKKLSLRYSLTQFTFWAATTGASSFATTYLLKQGVPSGVVGTMLAVAGVLSCVAQPILAGVADRSRRFLILNMLLGMSVLCVLGLCAQLVPDIPILVAGLCYMVSIWSANAMLPLTNALYVSYSQMGYAVNYGAGRGIGSVASAISSLVMGYVLAMLGSMWMILIIIGFRLLCIFILLGYPKIEKPETMVSRAERSSSIGEFLFSYRWYCASLVGVLFLGMYHAMTENYLIAIVGQFGGDSSHVGTALFISAMVGAPVIFSFEKVRKFFSDTSLLKIAACSFLIKAVLFYFARSITTIYLLQLLQITSYAFLAPTQVYYAQAKVRQADMVKGQAFSTAAYALGCSIGNFAGGQLLGLGVQAILLAGIGMALAGTVIMFTTVTKTDLREGV